MMEQPTNQPTKPKIIILSFALVLVAFYLVLELVSYLSLSPEEKMLPPSQLLKVNQNHYIEDFSLKTGCLFTETVIGHPVLGYVHRQPEYMSRRCRKTTPVNNIGMRSIRDLPLIKNPQEFSVMIVGGSVAEQFANYQEPYGSFYFEQLLNKNFKLPSQKKFKVYNGAMGGWSMPNQLHMLEMYGERLDAIISLDGYNEADPVGKGKRLEQVFPDLFILANSRHNGFNQLYLRTLWALQYGLAHKIVKHSYFFNVSYKIMVAFFRNTLMSEELIDEFSKGNTENIKLSKEKAINWSLNSLQRYMVQFHELAKINKIKSIHFLQPTRLYGKKLTAAEKRPMEYVSTDVYLKLEKMYEELEKRKYPVYSLTKVFINEEVDIYADHIHYIKDKNDISKGNKIVAEEIVSRLKKIAFF